LENVASKEMMRATTTELSKKEYTRDCILKRTSKDYLVPRWLIQ
jgi:hypothetical protein